MGWGWVGCTNGSREGGRDGMARYGFTHIYYISFGKRYLGEWVY